MSFRDNLLEEHNNKYNNKALTIIPTAPLKKTVNKIMYTCPSSASAPTKKSEQVILNPSLTDPAMMDAPKNTPKKRLISTALVTNAMTKMKINGMMLTPARNVWYDASLVDDDASSPSIETVTDTVDVCSVD